MLALYSQSHIQPVFVLAAVVSTGFDRTVAHLKLIAEIWEHSDIIAAKYRKGRKPVLSRGAGRSKQADSFTSVQHTVRVIMFLFVCVLPSRKGNT